MLEKWKKFFRDPTCWWDNRFNKKNKFFSETYPDFKHVSTGESLWIADSKTPTWVSAKLELLADPAVGKATTTRYKSPHTGDDPLSLGRLMNCVRESAKSRCLSMGKQAHEALLKSEEHKSSIYLLTGLIDMYCKCGDLEEARKIFDSMGTRNVVSFNAIINGCSSNGQTELALEYYSALRADTTVQPNDRSHAAAISGCSKLASESSAKRERALRIGMEIHSSLSKQKKQLDLFVATCLVDMYCKCGVLEEARKIFDSMGTRDSVSYNAIIHGCSFNGQAELALEYYSALRADNTIQPNDRTHVAVISACSRLATESSDNRERALRIGIEMHSTLSKQKKRLDLFVANCLVDMYCKCGELEEARKIFDSMGTRSVVSYNAIIQGCGSNGQAELALEYYSALRVDTTIQPNDRTHVAVISACSRLATEYSEKRERAVRIGMEIHSMLSKEKKQIDLFVANSLVDMYCKCGELEEARQIFDSMGTRDSVSYTAIINGCNSNGQAELALEYYSALRADTTIQPDDRTHVAVISACSILAMESSEKRERAVRIGMEIHSMLSKEKKQLGLYVATCLVDMYARFGDMQASLHVFEEMPSRDTVSWTALIQGYVLNKEWESAIREFQVMRRGEVQQIASTTDACTYTCVLVACGGVMAIRLGREIHHLAKHKGLLKNDPVLVSSLVSFYGKCGDVVSAQEAFEECRARDYTHLWNSLIQAYTLQGRSIEALERFYSMEEEGCKADDVTFVTVLNACSHGGLVEKGRQLLDEMPKHYGVKPRLEHYACLIDMLGRANLLDEALRVLRTMPFEADAVVWRSLLGACRKWKNCTIGQVAFERLVEMDPKHGVPYVLMANIFGSLGMHSERAAVVERMTGEHSSIWKGERSLWTDASSGIVHSFTGGDTSHSQSQEIAANLTQLSLRMKEEGYASDVINVVKDIPEKEKEDDLCGHTEKLAVACALVNSHHKETIRIVKNLRVCDDCHTAIAVISKLENRRIICRDSSWVHVFQDGRCSCDNYF